MTLQSLPDKATEKFNRDQRFDEIDEEFRFNDAQITFDDLQAEKEAAIPCQTPKKAS